MNQLLQKYEVQFFQNTTTKKVVTFFLFSTVLKTVSKIRLILFLQKSCANTKRNRKKNQFELLSKVQDKCVLVESDWVLRHMHVLPTWVIQANLKFFYISKMFFSLHQNQLCLGNFRVSSKICLVFFSTRWLMSFLNCNDYVLLMKWRYWYLLYTDNNFFIEKCFGMLQLRRRKFE